MIDPVLFDIIISDYKLHPQYHCDVIEGPYLYGERHKICSLGQRCSVGYGHTYHHDCAERLFGGRQCYVCECSLCEPSYSFYFPIDIAGLTTCPWCREHCRG